MFNMIHGQYGVWGILYMGNMVCANVISCHVIYFYEGKIMYIQHLIEKLINSFPPTNGVAKVMFSFVSVHQSVHRGNGIPCDHYLRCIGLTVWGLQPQPWPYPPPDMEPWTPTTLAATTHLNMGETLDHPQPPLTWDLSPPWTQPLLY